MSHRVIQFDSIISSQTEASNLKNEIKDYLVSKGFDLHDNQVNDGENSDGEITLAVHTDHNKATEANVFFDWLKSFANNNQAEYDTGGNVVTDGFEQMRINIHDCQHLASPSEKEFLQDIRGHYTELSQSEVETMFADYEYGALSSNHDCENGNHVEFDLRPEA